VLAAATARVTLLHVVNTAAAAAAAHVQREKSAKALALSKRQKASSEHELKQQLYANTVSAVTGTGAAPVHDMIPPNSLYSDVEPVAVGFRAVPLNAHLYIYHLLSKRFTQ
jgi:hypothetical protein